MSFTDIIHNTVVNFPRLFMLQYLANEVRGLDGDIAEVGVFKGGTAYLLAHANKDKVCYFFDTFKGMPDQIEEVDGHKAGDFKEGTIQHVENVLNHIPVKNYGLYQGIFPQDTGYVIKNEEFSLVHIDVDIYQSVKDCLEFFYPRMVKGGYMISDDYSHPACKGAKKAVDEFALKHGLTVQPTVECQAVIKI